MSAESCSTCGFRSRADEVTCAQCGAMLPKTDSTTASEAANAVAEEQLRQINELRAIAEKLQEAATPARTTSIKGCGIMLLDYRPVENGNYEASRWITLFGFPLVPLGVWKIAPRRYKQDHTGEQQTFQLLGKRAITFDRIIRPYLFLSAGALAFLPLYYFLKPVVYSIGRALGSWAAVAFIILIIALSLAWIGFIMTRFHNANTACKQINKTGSVEDEIKITTPFT